MSVAAWFHTELKHSKTTQSDVTWGRKVISAIDLDDCVTLGTLFDSRKYPQSNIDTQTTFTGYAGYVWTITIHKYLGDTALHYALKQSKLYCLYMLLLLDADVTIPNANQERPDEMIQQIYQTTYQNLKYDGKRKILNHISMKEFDLLPSCFECQKIEKEAWKLIHSGRILYTELPKALANVHKPMKERIQVKDVTRGNLSFNSVLKGRGEGKEKRSNKNMRKKSDSGDEERNVDEEYEEGNPEVSPEQHNSVQANSFTETDQFSPLVPKKREKRLSEWAKLQTPDGYVYYMHKKTGESTWTKPDEYFEESVSLSKESGSLNSKNSKLLKEKRRRRKERSNAEYEEDGEGEEDESSVVSSLYEDVWTKDNLSDILSIIIRQKQRFFSKILPPDMYTARGLSLLSSIKLGDNPLEQNTLKEKQILEEGRSDVLSTHLPNILQQMPKVTEKLQMFSFIKDLSYFQKLANEIQQTNSGGGGGGGDTKQLKNSAYEYTPTLSDKILFQQQSSKYQSSSLALNPSLSIKEAKKVRNELNFTSSYKLVSDQDKQPPSSSLKAAGGGGVEKEEGGEREMAHKPTQPEGVGGYFRDITILSTYSNMKYMQIGDIGAFHLADALYNDPIIVQLTLSCARITDEGMMELVQAIPVMHKLKYLDLSGNSLTDKSAMGLSDVLLDHRTLRVMSVAGNRIGLKGICHIASSIVSSHISLHEEQQMNEQQGEYGMFEREGVNNNDHGRVQGAKKGIDQTKHQKENRIVWCSVKNNAIDEKDRETIIKLFEEYEFEYDYVAKTKSLIFHQRKGRLFHNLEKMITLPERSENTKTSEEEEGEGEEGEEGLREGNQKDDKDEEEDFTFTAKNSLEERADSKSKSKARDVIFSPHSSLGSIPNGSQITESLSSMKKAKASHEESMERKTRSLSLKDKNDDDEEEESDNDLNIVDELSEMTDLESIDRKDQLSFIV